MAKIYTTGHDEAREEIRREQEQTLNSDPGNLGEGNARKRSRGPFETDACLDGSKEGYYPPRDLIDADDPSTKKEDGVFGIDITDGEAELRDALCPPGCRMHW